jgi:hypothetical protein
VFEELVKKWRKEADDEDGWTSRESRWFSSLSEEEKNQWRYSQARATGLRQCANELEQLLRRK